MTIADGVLGAIARANDAAQALEKMKTDSAARVESAKLSMAKESMAAPDSGSGWDAKPANPDSGSAWSAAPATPNSGWSAAPANPDSGSGWSGKPDAPGSAANPIRYQPGMPELPSGTYVIHPDGTLVVVP
jgi:hypothetical protein